MMLELKHIEKKFALHHVMVDNRGYDGDGIVFGNQNKNRFLASEIRAFSEEQENGLKKRR